MSRFPDPELPELPTGKLIAFEGIDGSGKTTVIRRVFDEMIHQGVPVVLTREPGGTDLGSRIRALLLDQGETMYAETELLLMCADRAEHVRSFILPALAKGTHVLTDRYAASTLAYQGYGSGLDLAIVRNAIDVAIAGLWPDSTILIDVPVDAANERRASDVRSLNTIDRRDRAYRDRVRNGFLNLADSDPRWRRIDGSLPLDSVVRSARAAVEAALAESPAS